MDKKNYQILNVAANVNSLKWVDLHQPLPLLFSGLARMSSISSGEELTTPASPATNTADWRLEIGDCSKDTAICYLLSA
ncbi:MAG: hypothetical protein Q7K21_04940, partial [Elusimicrobiota bacterium]|nr:hypothetical protein [Elusimicrobiota bacterium]